MILDLFTIEFIKMRKIVIIIVGLMMLSACTHRIIDFTIISTKNIDLSQAHKLKRGAQRVSGEDTRHIIVIIPIGSMPNLKEAVDTALEKIPGAVALLDGVIYRKSWYIPWIYGEDSYIVEGTALIDPNILIDSRKISSSNISGKFVISSFDSQGNLETMREVSESEYIKTKQKFF